MRATLLFGAAVLFAGLAGPASAQMCDAGQKAGGGQSAGMCGMMTQAQAPMAPAQSAEAPAATPDQTPPAAQSGCACCRNMAMMHRGGDHQGGHPMPGMETPKQQ